MPSNGLLLSFAGPIDIRVREQVVRGGRSEQVWGGPNKCGEAVGVSMCVPGKAEHGRGGYRPGERRRTRRRKEDAAAAR